MWLTFPYWEHINVLKFETNPKILEVESRRHTNPTTPVEQRNCNAYHGFEDECHYLLCWHIFANERHDHLRRIQNKLPDLVTIDHMEKFTLLIQIKTPKLSNGLQNLFIMLWPNGIIRPIISLVICDSQCKTGSQPDRVQIRIFLTWYIFCVCISSWTYLHICWFNFDALAQGNAYKPTKEPINYRGPGGDRTHDLQTIYIHTYINMYIYSTIFPNCWVNLRNICICIYILWFENTFHKRAPYMVSSIRLEKCQS